jgi:phage repressor protein C with HTH and peptisase S24 domain
MDKPAIEIVRGLVKNKAYKVTEIAAITGINRDKLYKWMDGSANPKTEDNAILEKWLQKLEILPNNVSLPSSQPVQPNYLATRRNLKNENNPTGMPVFESAPATLSVVESYRDEKQDYPDFWLSIPQYRKCTYACRAKGDSMHPLIRNHALVGGMEIVDMNVIIFGDVYIVHTKNGIETIKYIHPHPSDEEKLLLVPYNEHAKTTPLHKRDIIRLYQAQFVLNPI